VALLVNFTHLLLAVINGSDNMQITLWRGAYITILIN